MAFGELLGDPVYIFIIALFCAMVLVGFVNSRWLGSVGVALLQRWMRMAFFSAAGAVCLRAAVGDRSIIVLLACSVLICFLLETVVYWIGISLENYACVASGVPKFEPAENAWSSLQKFIRLKNRILSEGFKKSGSFRMPIAGDSENGYVLATTFDSADMFTRMCVIFPFGDSRVVVTSVKSLLSDGRTVVTESRPIPNGLDFPREYDVENHPMLSNPLSVLKIHLRRMKTYSAGASKIIKPPLEDLNGEIDAEMSVNLKSGLINPPYLWDECGVYTEDGKYRIWASMVKMRYFPFL